MRFFSATKELGTKVCLKWLVAAVMMGTAISAFAANADYGNCKVTGQRGIVKLKTIVPDTLSVRPYLPAPGFWNGDSFATIKDGFEYCLAANIAYRAGLDHLKLISESFAQVVAGQTNRFDIALSQISITDARKKVVDFTVPYYTVEEAVLVRAGTKVDSKSIKNLRLGTERGTTMVPFIKEKIRPTKPLKVFTATATMYAALAARQVDAVFYDSETLRTVAAQSGGRFVVAGVYPASGQKIGGVVGKDSSNLAAFNTIIKGLKQDGTVHRLVEKYLVPNYGGISLSQLPVLTVQ